MDIRIDSRIKPKGGVSLPPSKSEAIRAALLYALAGEAPEKAVVGFPAPYCGDIMAALAACRDISRAYVGESAALLRFLIPVQAALYGRVDIEAGEALYKRGLSEAEACLGVRLEPRGGRITADFRRYKRRYEIDCSRSSQFLSGLMIALPLLKHECEIVVKNGLVSKPYADMTFEFVRLFGGDIERTETGFLTRPSAYRAPERASVFGDRSYAAVFEAMDLFGGEITVWGERDPMQPDSDFLLISSLPVIDVTDCPDLLPLLAVTACGKAGETVIIGTKRLSAKESDRPKAVAALINSLGGSAKAQEDRLVVHGSGHLEGGRCSSFGDHRIAFAAAVAALISNGPVTVEGAECVKKSAPRFWEDLVGLGMEITEVLN